MVKLLIASNLLNSTSWDTFVARLHALQSSQHGPFDCVLVAGSLFTNEDQLQYALKSQGFEEGGPSRELPLHCYAIDKPNWVASKYYQLPDGNSAPVESCFDNRGKFRLPRKMSYISSEIHDDVKVGAEASAGMATLHSLTVAFQNMEVREADTALLTKYCARSAYRGCDILLTSGWPAELHHFLSASDLDSLRSLQVGLGSGVASAGVCAMSVLPRYHVSGGDVHKNIFYQRPPYINSNTGHVAAPVTRFVSLAHIGTVPAVGADAKSVKYVHALSLEPIVHMTNSAICEIPLGSTECPYASGAKTNQCNNDLYRKRSGFDDSVTSEGSNKRFKAEGSGATTGANFFGAAGLGPDGVRIGAKSANLVPPSPEATLLFLGGLPALPNTEFLSLFPGSTSMRRPEGKTFGFLDFSTHAAALKVVEESSKRAILVSGRPITVGWAAASNDKSTKSAIPPPPPLPRTTALNITQPPSTDCRVLFLGNLPPDIGSTIPGVPVIFTSITSVFVGVKAFRRVPNKRYAFVEFGSHGEALFAFNYARNFGPIKLTGAKLKHVTHAGGPASDSGTALKPDGSINVETELQEYEISVNWAAHANATATPVAQHPHIQKLPRSSYDASSYTAPHISHSTVPSGDHAGDCWFCLASPTVKTHLIISIAEHAYIALPVGPVHPLHCMICPIECVSSKALLTSSCLQEMHKYETAIEQLFRRQDMAMLTYERAIRTRGRDHMQVHCIPVPISCVNHAEVALATTVQRLSKGQQSRATTVAATVATNIDNDNLILHELDEEEIRGVEAVISTMPGGPYTEYFHCSIPVPVTFAGVERDETKVEAEAADYMKNFSGVDWRQKRFLYVHKVPPNLPASGTLVNDVVASATATVQFPMQLGPEIALSVIEEEQNMDGRSRHWKNKRATVEEEIALVEEFRKKFDDLDFTQHL